MVLSFATIRAKNLNCKEDGVGGRNLSHLEQVVASNVSTFVIIRPKLSRMVMSRWSSLHSSIQQNSHWDHSSLYQNVWFGLRKNAFFKCFANFASLVLSWVPLPWCASPCPGGFWEIFKIQIPRDANIPHFSSSSAKFPWRNNFSVCLRVIFTSRSEKKFSA